MSTVSNVFHSGYGHTRRMAESVRDGVASVAGVTAKLVAIDAEGNLPEGGFERLAASDGIVFGSPTYMGGVSWQFKKFADASAKVWFTHGWKDKFAAGFTNSASPSGDKLSTLQYFFTLAMQHGMIFVGTGMMPSSAKAAQRSDLNHLGSFAGAMAQTPNEASVDEMIPGDLETARKFGERFGNAVLTHRPRV